MTVGSSEPTLLRLPDLVTVVPAEEVGALLERSQAELTELAREATRLDALAVELEAQLGTATADPRVYEWMSLRLRRFLDATRDDARGESLAVVEALADLRPVGSPVVVEVPVVEVPVVEVPVVEVPVVEVPVVEVPIAGTALLATIDDVADEDGADPDGFWEEPSPRRGRGAWRRHRALAFQVSAALLVVVAVLVRVG